MANSTKTALSVGAAAIASGVTVALVSSQPIVGGLMILIGAGLVVADYLYGKYNRGEPLVIPEQVDEPLIRDLAEAGEDEVQEVLERYSK